MKDNKCIIIIDGYYFDVTQYLDKHPGGRLILRKHHMKDATTVFNSIKGHGDSYAIDLMESMCIGKVNNNNNE
tara:strand:- start:77 stop:295 length:219 start_codon:yes stop_codon:yes gene_type:complete